MNSVCVKKEKENLFLESRCKNLDNMIVILLSIADGGGGVEVDRYFNLGTEGCWKKEETDDEEEEQD